MARSVGEALAGSTGRNGTTVDGRPDAPPPPHEAEATSSVARATIDAALAAADGSAPRGPGR
jgi:hypothetical protein